MKPTTNMAWVSAPITAAKCFCKEIHNFCQNVIGVDSLQKLRNSGLSARLKDHRNDRIAF